MQAYKVMGQCLTHNVFAGSRLIAAQCKLDHPCLACVKACGDFTLGETICVRQSLLDVRFAHGMSTDTQE